MRLLRTYLSIVGNYLSSRDWWVGFIKYLLTSFGAIWLVTEAVSYFNESAGSCLSTKGYWFVVIGFLIAFILSRPKTVFRYQLKNRDVTIEVRIANAFKVSGDLVVPINTTFDTDFDGKIPKAQSIQGKFTRCYYESELSHLDLDINTAMGREDYPYKELPQKKVGKTRQYPIGAVIQLNRKNRLFYLLANTHINNNGVANTTIENVRESLAKLWYYISEKGSKGDIVIPLLGTGKGRLGDKREDIFLEIIRSFIASCSSSAYCDKLIVVIYPLDVTKWKIDLNYIQCFLECACKYANFEA